MATLAWKEFIHRLADICQQSGASTWQATLQQALTLFAETSQAGQAALLLLDADQIPCPCLDAGQDAPTPLCADLQANRGLWQEDRLGAGLESVTFSGRETPVWLLPVPARDGPPVALFAFADVPAPPPRELLEEGSALLTPLIQNQRLDRQTDRRLALAKRQRTLAQAIQKLSLLTDVDEMLAQLEDSALQVIDADKLVVLSIGANHFSNRRPENNVGSDSDFLTRLCRQRPDLVGPNRLNSCSRSKNLGSATSLIPALSGLGESTMASIHIRDAWQPSELQQWGLDVPDTLAAAAQREGFHTALVLPLQIPDRPLGALAFYRVEMRPFFEEEISLAQTLASQVAMALHNAYLFRQERDQRDLANAMAEAAAALTRSLDQDQVLDQILEQVKRVLPHDTCNVMLIKGDEVQIVRWRGYSRFEADNVVASVRLPLDTPNLRMMMETRSPVAIPDTRNSAQWVHVPGLEWLRSYAASPLVIGDQVIGFISVDSSSPDFFTEKHAQRLKAFADYAAIAIQNARLYQGAKRRTEERAVLLDELQQRQAYLESLNTIIATINSAVNLDDILRIGLEQALQVAGMPRGGIYLLDRADQRLKLRVYSGLSDEDLADARVCPPGQGIPGKAFAEKQVIVERALLKVSPETPQEGGPLMQVQIGLPLIVENQAVGVMNLNTPRGRDVSQHLEQLLQAITDQLALAVQRGQLTSQMREQLQTVRYLYEISAAFLSQMGTGGVLFVLLRTLTDLIEGALGAAFYQREDAAWKRTRVYTTRKSPGLGEKWREGPIWEGEIVHLTACQREHMLVMAGRKRGRIPSSWAQIEALGGNQVLYFPLFLPNYGFLGVVGVMLAEERELSAHETVLSWAIIQQGTAALVRVTLYEDSRKSESRMRAILESSRDGIFLVGSDLDIHYVNGQALRLLNLSGEPVTWESSTLPTVIAAVREEAPDLARWVLHVAREAGSLDAVPEDEEAPIFETTSGLALKLQTWPVFSERDERLGTLFLIRDVTEQRTLEQMRGDLLNMLVHDMRNPLAVIQNGLQLLRDPLMCEVTHEIIDLAAVNAERMLDLVNTILEIGKLEVGRFELYRDAVSLPEHVNEIAKELIGPTTQFDLQVCIPAELPLMWIDPGVITRVFENILGNALKFIPEEGGLIRISATYDDAWVKVEVYNNGPHIPPDTLKRLFQKFATGQYSERGYGLGLAFCKLAVEAHGGRIWVENRPEGGVSFYFTLPVLAIVELPDDLR